MNELATYKQNAMAFELPDKTIIWIDKEACKQIALQIIAERMIDAGTIVNIIKSEDSNAKKGRELMDFVKDQKDLPSEILAQYHETIMYLMSNTSEVEHIVEKSRLTH